MLAQHSALGLNQVLIASSKCQAFGRVYPTRQHTVCALTRARTIVQAAQNTVQWWDGVTQRLVDVSTIAFVFLLLPQLIKNQRLLTAGNAAALGGLAWEVRFERTCQCLSAQTDIYVQ